MKHYTSIHRTKQIIYIWYLTYLYQSSRNANARKQITIHAVKAVGLQASLVNNAIANWKNINTYIIRALEIQKNAILDFVVHHISF